MDRRLDKFSPLCPALRDMYRFVEGGPKGRVILAPRGLGKTYSSMFLGLYRLNADPNHKVLIVSKSETHAKKVIKTMRQWIEQTWFLRHLIPEDGMTDSVTRFDVGGSSSSVQQSVTAIGVDGQLEGNRAHTIIADDVETDKNVITIESRDALNERTKEFRDILYPDIDGKQSEIVFIGTPHHADTVYYKLRERQYEVRTWPIAIPQENDRIVGLAPYVRKMIDLGKRTWTVNRQYEKQPIFARFGRRDIVEKKAEGQARFDMQHLLIADNGTGDRYPLALRDLMVMSVNRDKAPIYVMWGTRDHNGSTQIDDLTFIGRPGDGLFRPPSFDPTWGEYHGTKAYIDPAGKGEDDTVVAIASCLNGIYWVKAVTGIVGGASESAMNDIATLLRDHLVHDVYYECNMDTFGHYGQVLQAAITRHALRPGQNPKWPKGWGATLTPDRVSVQRKEERIIGTLRPLFQSHRVVVDPSVINVPTDRPRERTLQYQLSNITYERKCIPHDDYADALAGVLGKWEGASVDPVAFKDRAELNVLKDERRRLRRSMGMSTPVSTWHGL